MSKRSIRSEIRSVENEIDRAIEDGMSGRKGVMDNAIEAAKRRIRRKDRVWHERVLKSFKKEISDYDGVYTIVNTAYHAKFVDEGGEFDNPPPPENLLPWVRDHMFIFTEYDDPEDAAQALSISLYRDGLDGIMFTESMLRYLNTEAETDLEQLVNAELSKRL